MVAVGDAVPSDQEIATRFDVDADAIKDSPFVMAGSVEQIVDKLECIRAATGISHYVVREPDAFAPVSDVLTGR